MTSSTARSRANSAYTVKLLASTALVGSAMLAASVAYAQETVTVTGTSIRGERPVGANVITVDRTAIEESGATTISELMTNIPQITGAAGGFGSSGQRNEGGGGAIASPNIHSLGTQASTATLILIDGHVFAPSGQTTNVVDPSVIPAAALQRVDVLPDGESAIYGANAVAGVINYITRRDYSGWETRVSTGIADHYNSFSFSQVFGHNWDTGSVMAVYAYNNRSSLNSMWRQNFLTSRQDIRMGVISAADIANFTNYQNSTGLGFTPNPPAGSLLTLPIAPGVVAGSSAYRGKAIPWPSMGTNGENFNCPVAAISSTSTGTAFLFPYDSGAGSINNVTVANGSGGTTTQNGFSRSVTGGAGQGICDQDFYSSQLISDQSQNGIITIRQQLTDSVSVNVDLVRGSHLTLSRNSRGNVSATVFNGSTGTGGPAFGSNQSNPFFVQVPGTTGTQRNSEFITFNFDELLGPGAYSKNNTTQQFATFGLDADLGSNWALTIGSTLGQSSTGSRSAGGVNAAEVDLALNGTVNTTGSGVTGISTSALADPYGLGTIVSVTRALTTANALDVWNPAATNRTSPSVLRSITDSATQTVVYNNVADLTAKVDGPLFDPWGAGVIKSAFGANFNHLTQPQYVTGPVNGTGPASTSTRGLQFLGLQRTSYAVFAEFLIPLVSQDMGIPLVQKMSFDLSGRWDHFSDFGETKNPKLALTWDLFSGLSARGSFSTSFVAPNVHDVGGKAGVNSQTAVSATQINHPAPYAFLAARPDPYSQDPFSARGVGVAGTFVQDPTSCLELNSTPGLISTTAKVTDINGNTPTSGTFGTAPGQTFGCLITTASNAGFGGLQIGGANNQLKPERGVTFSAGVDLDAGQFFDFLEGLTANVTYYQTKFIDVITNQQVQINIPEATSFGPACGTGSTSFTPGTVGCLPGWAPSDPNIQALVSGRALSNPLPSRIYTIVDNRIQNPFTIWQGGLDFGASYRFDTDTLGTFTLSANGNQVIRFSQKANSATATVLDVNDCKNGARYCTSEMAGSLRLGWRFQDISAGVTFNFTHPYWSPSGSFPYSLAATNAAGVITRPAGFEKVGSLQTFDLNFSYTLPDEWLSGSQLNVTVTNLLDKPPPFFNNTSGFTNGSELGRLINVGIVKKW